MDGWNSMVLDGWVGGWMAGRAVLRIAYSNKKNYNIKMSIIMSNELL